MSSAGVRDVVGPNSIRGALAGLRLIAREPGVADAGDFAGMGLR
jgi:hypothetical protein